MVLESRPLDWKQLGGWVILAAVCLAGLLGYRFENVWVVVFLLLAGLLTTYYLVSERKLIPAYWPSNQARNTMADRLVQWEKLSLVATRTSSGVIITDATGRLEWANEAFSKITGYSFEDVKGRKPGSFLQGQATNPDTIEYIRQSLRQGHSFQCEILNYRKNGQPYWNNFKADPIFDEQGRLRYYIAISSDITESKTVEENLRRATAELSQSNRQLAAAHEQSKQLAYQAEEANAAKSRFLANFSHELRTPLNGILGYTRLLELNERLNEDDRERLKIIRRSGEHLLHLINDILDLSKIEAGRFVNSPSSFQLGQHLDELASLVGLRAAEKGLDFQWMPWDFERRELATVTPQGVFCDSKALRQILINLLGNAVKFTDRGHVLLRYGPVDSVEKMGHAIQHQSKPVANAPTILFRFEIEDTGIGIPEEYQPHIFDEFHQTPESRQRAGGTGLGLAISRRLARQMGGDLLMSSIHGQGSRFWCDLPLTVESLAAVGPATASPDRIKAPALQTAASQPQPDPLQPPSPSTRPDQTICPARSDLLQLQHLAALGDVFAIRHLTEAKIAENSPTTPFWRQIEALARNFQTEKIAILTETILAHSTV